MTQNIIERLNKTTATAATMRKMKKPWRILLLVINFGAYIITFDSVAATTYHVTAKLGSASSSSSSSSPSFLHSSSTAFLPLSNARSRIAASTSPLRRAPNINHCAQIIGFQNPLTAQLSLLSLSHATKIKIPNSISVVAVAVANFYVTFPFVASFLTASILAALADAVAQFQDECVTRFDVKRNLAMILYSGIVSGICVEFMYSHIFPQIFGLSGEESNLLLHALKMTLVDEGINAPILWLPPAYIFQAILYRTSKREAVRKYIMDVKRNGLLTKYWSLWIPMSFINFSIIPSHFRVAFVAVVSFFWMIILSIVANRSGDEEKDSEPCPVE